MLQREIVRFRAADDYPNPLEVDYWIDLSENRYGGIIKYFRNDTCTWEVIEADKSLIEKLAADLKKWVEDMIAKLELDLWNNINIMNLNIERLRLDLQKLITNLRTYVESIIADLRTYVDNSLQTIRNDFNEFKEEVNSRITSLIKYVDDSINNLKQYVNTEINDLKRYVDLEITKVNSNITNIENQLNNQGDNITTIETDITALRNRVSSLETRINNLQSALDNHAARRDNPHVVTRGQLGLATTDSVEFRRVNAPSGFYKE